MSAVERLGLLRYEAMACALPAHRYCEAQGIDWSLTRAAAGGLFLSAVRPVDGSFVFDERGALAAWIDVFDVDACTPVDMIAWPLERPGVVWHASDAPAPILGLSNLLNPATYVGGQPCRLHRTALAWCQSGCRGAVIFDPVDASPWLEELPGRLAPEDQAHLDFIARGFAPLQHRPDFVLPVRRTAA